jgi:hypothetical protein
MIILFFIIAAVVASIYTMNQNPQLSTNIAQIYEQNKCVANLLIIVCFLVCVFCIVKYGKNHKYKTYEHLKSINYNDYDAKRCPIGFVYVGESNGCLPKCPTGYVIGWDGICRKQTDLEKEGLYCPI